MTIQILDQQRGPHGFYFRAACDKITALVTVHSWGFQICCENNAHKVWRGMGKHFPTLEAALAGYKSGEMKAIIQAAADAAKGAI